MKFTTTLVGTFFLSGIAFCQEPFSTPEQFSIERYARILDKSPFAQATLLQESAPQESFSKDLVLVSHYRLGGILYVNLLDRKSQQRLVITSEGDASTGMKAIALNSTGNPWEAKAVIECRGEKGTVGYDPPKFQPPPAGQSLAAAQPGKSQSEPVRRTRVRSPQDD